MVFVLITTKACNKIIYKTEPSPKQHIETSLFTLSTTRFLILYSNNNIKFNSQTTQGSIFFKKSNFFTFQFQFQGVSRIRNMCPMRFILVFFSAVLAGYFAWRSVRSSPEVDKAISEGPIEETALLKENQESNLKTMVQNGFWVFVDMASGRYLWRNLREMKKD